MTLRRKCYLFLISEFRWKNFVTRNEINQFLFVYHAVNILAYVLRVVWWLWSTANLFKCSNGLWWKFICRQRNSVSCKKWWTRRHCWSIGEHWQCSVASLCTRAQTRGRPILVRCAIACADFHSFTTPIEKNVVFGVVIFSCGIPRASWSLVVRSWWLRIRDVALIFCASSLAQ